MLWRNSDKDLQKLSVKSVLFLNRLRVSLIAVFLPIPGSLANSSTALSNKAEEC
jgi:hypothetical protein